MPAPRRLRAGSPSSVFALAPDAAPSAWLSPAADRRCRCQWAMALPFDGVGGGGSIKDVLGLIKQRVNAVLRPTPRDPSCPHCEAALSAV